MFVSIIYFTVINANGRILLIVASNDIYLNFKVLYSKFKTKQVFL